MKLAVYGKKAERISIAERLDQINVERPITEIRVFVESPISPAIILYGIQNRKYIKLLDSDADLLLWADALLLFSPNEHMEVVAHAKGLPIYNGEVL